MPFLRSLTVISLLALAGCGGIVAADAPALLTQQEIAARSDGAVDTARGARVSGALAWRGARLRARAAQMRRAGIDDAERRRLLLRADSLKSQ